MRQHRDSMTKLFFICTTITKFLFVYIKHYNIKLITYTNNLKNILIPMEILTIISHILQ